MRAKFVNIDEGVDDKYLFNKYGIEDKFEKIYKSEQADKAENCIGKFKDWDNYMVKVYLNPSSLKMFGNWNRACSDEKGNLYLADSIEILHDELVAFLSSKDIKGNLINWQQYKDSNVFYLAEGYDLNEVGLDNSLSDEEIVIIKKHTPIVIKNHPQFNFRTDMTILSANAGLNENYSQDNDPYNFAAW